MRTTSFLAFAVCVIVAISCGGHADAPPAAPPSVFIAFATDFDRFRSWASFDPPAVAPGDDHLTGPRTVYYNELPAAGSHEFPVGTILVKESGLEDPAKRDVFAMVKRGGDFNASGALDWEWFRLQNQPDGTVTIVWRGVGPADGDAYGGDATGGCNSCHGTAHATDFVFSSALTTHLATAH